MIDLGLMKQVTELGDWLFSLPVKIVEAVLGPREAFLRGKNEIDRLEELKALSEVGQQLTTIYGFKGNVYKWTNRLQAQKQVEEVEHVRLLFHEAAWALRETEELLKGTRLSNLALASEAAFRIADAKETYESLARLSDADILEDRGLIDLIDEMDRLMESGAFLTRLADHHRKELESKKDGSST